MMRPATHEIGRFGESCPFHPLPFFETRFWDTHLGAQLRVRGGAGGNAVMQWA
jgi:hypothetical protein